MLINSTKCEDCIKQDVCNLKEKYKYALVAIASTNTSNEDMAIHEANQNDAIKLTSRCTKFVENSHTLK